MVQAISLTLEEFAQLTARIELGETVARVVADKGLEVEQWTTIQQTWLSRMAKRAAKGKPSLHKRFVELLEEQRVQLLVAQRDKKAADGAVPKPPKERRASLAREARRAAPKKPAMPFAPVGRATRPPAAPSSVAPPSPVAPAQRPAPDLSATAIGDPSTVLPFKQKTADHSLAARHITDGALPFATPARQRPAPAQARSGGLPFRPRAPAADDGDTDGTVEIPPASRTGDPAPVSRPGALPFAAAPNSAAAAPPPLSSRAHGAAMTGETLDDPPPAHASALPFGGNPPPSQPDSRSSFAQSPAQPAPAQPAPAQPAPAQPAPAQPAPAQPAPAQPAPPQPAPAQPAPAADISKFAATMTLSSAELLAARASFMPFANASAKRDEEPPRSMSPAEVARLQAALPFGTPPAAAPPPRPSESGSRGGLPFVPAAPPSAPSSSPSAALPAAPPASPSAASPSAASPSAASPSAASPSAASTPTLSVEQYAWLCATLERSSDRATETLAFLRLTELAKRDLDAYWQRELARDPDLRRRFDECRQAYLTG